MGPLHPGSGDWNQTWRSALHCVTPRDCGESPRPRWRQVLPSPESTLLYIGPSCHLLGGLQDRSDGSAMVLNNALPEHTLTISLSTHLLEPLAGVEVAGTGWVADLGGCLPGTRSSLPM